MDSEQISGRSPMSHTENNLNKRRSMKKQLQNHPNNMNYGKHLDAWLDNSIKGLEISSPSDPNDNYTNFMPSIFTSGQPSQQQNLKINQSEPSSLPPQINFMDIPSSSILLNTSNANLRTSSSDNNEFVSLPPRIWNNKNITAQSINEFLSYSKGLSDPTLNDSSDSESKNSCNKSKTENNDGNTSGGGGTVDGNNNLIMMLLKEMNKLHETNKKICRNLHETKVEMEALKHTPYWGSNHRRDSISGLSTSSQPVGMRYNLGMQSPAPTYHSQGNYTPGFVTDVIREVRELTRVREEALLDRVKTMIEERSWSLNETNYRLMKESAEMKKQVQNVKSDMNQIVERMLKLENEVLTLKSQLMHNTMSTYPHQQESNVPYVSAMHAPKIKKNNFNLNYGRVSNDEELYMNCYGDLENDPRYNRNYSENRYMHNNGIYNDELQEEASDQVLLLEKDTLKLRRELQDALASKQDSENRISALENIVTSLKEQVPSSQATIPPEYYYHRSNNNKSPIQMQSSPMSPKPQKVAQIQTMSPKHHMLMSSSTVNMSGPITDL